MFDFYNDFDTLKQSDWQFKQDFKYKILNPFRGYEADTSLEDMEQIEVTLSICTLWNGVPHGLASIEYEDPDDDSNYWDGVGVFIHGQLHNTPFTYLDGVGEGYLFSKMENGRPADGSYHTKFFANGESQNVDSLETETDV